MPALTLAPVPASPTLPPRRRCRVFVSYAHQDALRPEHQPLAQSLVERFQIELKNMLQALAARGCMLHADEVFLDVQRLHAVEAWRPEIDRAVAECQMLIFLVSPDATASDFCVRQEVGPVARRGGLIVPVLLRETAGWKSLNMGTGATLGELHSGGLPKNQLGNAMAVSHPAWNSPDLAWAATTQALTDCIAGQLFGLPTTVPMPATTNDGKPHLVPSGGPEDQAAQSVELPADLTVAYFCDQLHVTTGFTDGVDAHLQRHPKGRPHALLAIVQGEYDDQPERMVDRLHHHHLAARLQVDGLAHARQRLPMDWPAGSMVDRPFAGRGVLKQLCETIDPRLAIMLSRCGNADEAAAEIDRHFANPAVPPVAVFALLPARDKTTTVALRNLVLCLDRCANAQGQMAKLAIYCVDEQPGARTHWARLVPRAERLATLALQPLKPFDEIELRKWHLRYRLEPRWPWPDCLRLFRHTVTELRIAQPELRLGQWADAVQRHRPDIARLIPPMPTAVQNSSAA